MIYNTKTSYQTDYSSLKVENIGGWTVLKAYKYRIYPNEEQKEQLSKIFGSCRFVYNKTLAYRKESFEKNKKHLIVKDCIDYYNNELKKENIWLSETDEQALISSIYHMEVAYRQSFRKNRTYPKFKSKHDSHKSYTTNTTSEEIVIDFPNDTIKLPMLPAIKAKLHREFTGQIKSATVSLTSSGKYFVAILADAEHQEIPQTTKSIGLNLKTKDSCVTSDGSEYIYDDFTSKYAKRLARLQKQLKHKEKGSNNYYKLKKDIALCHERITNVKKDNLHKITHDIVSENQVIIHEASQINNKTGDHYALLNDFLKILEYKAKWNNRTLVKIDPCVIGTLPDSHSNQSLNPQETAKHILTTGLNQLA